MPLVSVVIPTFNRAHLISDTLESVLNQTFRDFEIIVVDDGSTDNTPELIKGYGPQVRYIYQENSGQGAARNVGIHAACGDFIAFLDSDDLWLPSKLEAQMTQLLCSDSLFWAYCDMEMFDGQTGQTLGNYSDTFKPYQGMVYKQLILGDFIASPTPLVRKDIFYFVGYFEEISSLKGREDWDLWLRIAAHYPIIYIPKVLARYRIHKGNLTGNEDVWKVHQSNVMVIERTSLYAPDVYLRIRRCALAAQNIRTGRALAGLGYVKEARKMFIQAIYEFPGYWQAYIFYLITLLNDQFLSKLIKLNRLRRRIYWTLLNRGRN